MTGPAAPLLADLAEVGLDREEMFGGKAHGLARLLAAGARVPRGFAIAASTLPPDSWQPERRADLLRRGAGLLRGGPVAVRSSADNCVNLLLMCVPAPP